MDLPRITRCKKLIYYEWYRDIRDAIARESQLKKWSRAKKIALIDRLNPSWRDLGAGCAARQIASRDFSTPLEMTRRDARRPVCEKIVTATRQRRSLVMVWMRSRLHGRF